MAVDIFGNNIGVVPADGEGVPWCDWEDATGGAPLYFNRGGPATLCGMSGARPHISRRPMHQHLGGPVSQVCQPFVSVHLGMRGLRPVLPAFLSLPYRSGYRVGTTNTSRFPAWVIKINCVPATLKLRTACRSWR